MLAIMISFAACQKELKPATVAVKDPVRHYYPVIQGETLGVTYELENTSDNPLFIREIQTTCGCVVPRDELPIVVLPKKSGFVHLEFNTIKNNGYVCHWVYCYGNFKDSTCVELQFDTNVVPSADYIRDYEQLWHEQSLANRSLRDYVDGLSSQKGYYTDALIDPRAERSEERQDAIDNLTP
ncbi:MAG: DUF1573 domain-containing protein [Bacteroidaceae bacterium]|nr:DUF1573 domain-containing protein [Bacteroidaceae bacterium]